MNHHEHDKNSLLNEQPTILCVQKLASVAQICTSSTTAVYVDFIRVFNPQARSNWQSYLATTYCKRKAVKKRAYEQKARDIEHFAFAPGHKSSTVVPTSHLDKF